MTGSLGLLNLLGAVALLLWAVRMVRTGVERAYSARLRGALRRAAGNRLTAMLTGAAVAVFLQSSTAVAILLSGFAVSGALAPPVGLAMMLGADLGSALIVQLLSFDLSLLIPVCMLAGTVAFLSGRNRAWRQLGRIVMGLGLILLSLQMISLASAPMRQSEVLPLLIGYLRDDPISAFLLAALFTWIIHSSVAAVLLLVALTGLGLVPLELAFVFVLGANLGSGVIAVVLTRRSAPAARAIPLGNLFLRGGAAALATLGLWLARPLPLPDVEPGLAVALFHILFNLVLAVFALALVGPTTALCQRLLRTKRQDEAVGVEPVSALDTDALETPRLALASATREILQMTTTIEIMLRDVMALYESGDKEEIREFAKLDDRVDRHHIEIKRYLADLSQRPMNEEEARRCQELTTACIKLEHIGDIVARNLLTHAEKKCSRKLAFSKEGWADLTRIHDQVFANAQLAFNVLVSSDVETARELVQGKDLMRKLERQSNENHLARLGEGTQASIESSEIHLDTVRDLKQINSDLASLAYPVLEQSGELLDTRLAD